MMLSGKYPCEGVGLVHTSPFRPVHRKTSIGCLFFSRQLF